MMIAMLLAVVLICFCSNLFSFCFYRHEPVAPRGCCCTISWIRAAAMAMATTISAVSVAKAALTDAAAGGRLVSCCKQRTSDRSSFRIHAFVPFSRRCSLHPHGGGSWCLMLLLFSRFSFCFFIFFVVFV